MFLSLPPGALTPLCFSISFNHRAYLLSRAEAGQSLFVVNFFSLMTTKVEGFFKAASGVNGVFIM